MGRPKGITMKVFECSGCQSYGSKPLASYNRNVNNYCTMECYKANGCIGKGHRNIERITFNCENPKCNAELTESKKVYDKKKFHYCNIECKKSHTADNVEARRTPKQVAKKIAKKTFHERWDMINWEEAV